MEGKKGALSSKDALIEAVKKRLGTRTADGYLPSFDGWDQKWDAKTTEEMGKKLADRMHVNEFNFWLAREYLRTCSALDINYVAPRFIETLNETRPDLMWHFVHMSAEEPGMLAYTPSVAYGIADRQVRVKPGRYLTQFFSNHFTVSRIKQMADACNPAQMTVHDHTHIVRIYSDNLAPSSCMAGTSFDCDLDGHHPCEAYENDDWGIAVLTQGDYIVARALVCFHNKGDTQGRFVRTYGNLADTLAQKLKDAGYYYTDEWPNGARLEKIECSGGYVAPYLDGDVQAVHDKGEYFVVASRGNIYFGNSCGYTDDNRVRCSYCDERVSEDDTVETACGNTICQYCADNYYQLAYTSHRYRGHQSYVRENDAIEINGEYYLDDADVLEFHGMHQCGCDGKWYHEDDMVEVDGLWYRQGNEPKGEEDEREAA